jgi:hypothetical protein
MQAILEKTVFIGPVQAVKDHLNYTKISHFSLLELEQRPPGKACKNRPCGDFAHFSYSGFKGGCGKIKEVHCNESIRLWSSRFNSGSI